VPKDRPDVPGVQLLDELGRGAETVVYRADRDGAAYAVKALVRAGDAQTAADFRREAALLACVEHPCLVKVHEVGESAGRSYLIMDLIEGRSLAEALRDGPLDEPAAIALGTALAAALVPAHRAGLVHRDIKPPNVMISSAGRPYLIDFGLAARSGGRAGDVAVGTFAYSAPEQTGMLHRAVDGRADLYALGVLLYECVTGRTPFVADDPAELVRLHLSATPAPMTELRPDVSPTFAAVVARLLAKDPDDRYQTAHGLSADLADLAGGRLTETTVGATDRPGRGGDVELVGRTAEHTALRSRWDRARGGAGGVVLVRGATGAGKSRLVRELTTDVAAAGGLVLHVGCVADSGVPLSAMRGVVDRHIARLTRLPEPARGAAVAELRQIAGETAAVLAAMSPALGAVLDAPDLPEGDHERQLDEAVAALLVGMARAAGGAVLHLDDAHWCDERSRRVLRRLVPQLPDAPLLVVATGRDDADCHQEVESFAAGVAGALDLSLTLRPLAPDATAALVTGQLGSAVAPAELVTRVTARSAGNPMAVLEYVRAVVDAGLLRPYWGQWHLDRAGLESLALPDNVLDLVLRRIDGLGAAAHEVLTVAAAVGLRFTGDLVAAAAGVTEDAVYDVLTEAVGHRLVEAATGGGYRFLHDRIRETLLDVLDPPARRRLHHRIAVQLEHAGGTDTADVYEVARHYLLGDVDADPARVFAAAVAAGSLALRQHAAAEAVSLLTSAAQIAAAADLPLTGVFHADLGLAATRVGDHGKALQHLQRALDLEPDPMRRAWLCNLLADAHLLRHDAEQAIEVVRQGLEELGHPMPRDPLRLCVSTIGLMLWGIVLGWLPARWCAVGADQAPRYRLRVALNGTGGEAATVAQQIPLLIAMNLRTLPLARRLRPGPEYALNQAGLAFLAGATGLHRRFERTMARALTVAGSTGDLRLIARLHYFRTTVRDLLPPLTADSGKDMRQTLATQGRWLDFGLHLTIVAVLEQTCLARGHTAEAAELHRHTLAQLPGEDEVLGHVIGIAGVELAALSGRPAEAARQLAAVRAFLDSRPAHPVMRTKVAIAAVRLAVEQGELGAAFDDACAEFDALGVTPARAWAIDRMCWVYRAFGRLAQAAALPTAQRADRLAAAGKAVSELRSAAKGPVLRAYHDVARCALAQLAGDHHTALRRLAAQVVRADDLDLPLLHYEISRIRARAYRDLGRPTDARWHARIAQLLATDHGWLVRARWVRDEFTLDATPGGNVTAGTAAMVLHGGSGQTDRSLTARGVGSGIEQRRLQALQQVGLAAASVLDPVEVARLALDEIVTIFAAERAFLFVRETGEGAAEHELVPYIGRDKTHTDLIDLTGYGSTLVDRVATTGAPLVVAGSEEGAALGSQSTVVHGLRSIMVAPLLLKGRLLGVIYLDSRAAKGVFTPDDVDILVAISNHIATALETARAAQLELGIHAARRERDLAQLLHQAMTDLGGSLDPDEVAQRLIDTMTRALPVDSAMLLRRTGSDAFELTAAAGPATSVTDIDADCATWLNAVARQTGVASGPAGEATVTRLLGCTPGGWLVVPLITRGEDRGAVVAGTLAGRAYTEAEVEIATALAGQGAVALENAVLYRQVENLAIRDGLSGLFNRRHFFELAEQRLATSRRYRRPLAAIMTDIDHFKKINDTHGHSDVDEVIREISDRLAGALRDSDILCRYGGEEFAVLLPETSAEQGTAVADRLCATVNGTPVHTAAGPLAVTVSVGLAAPHGESDVNGLLKHADEALYVAKRSGRNQVAVA
jgi:diguanylate cyclase (GGDEF)-like protein